MIPEDSKVFTFAPEFDRSYKLNDTKSKSTKTTEKKFDNSDTKESLKKLISGDDKN